jgi:hypothetical protein
LCEQGNAKLPRLCGKAMRVQKPLKLVATEAGVRTALDLIEKSESRVDHLGYNCSEAGFIESKRGAVAHRESGKQVINAW